MSLSFTQSPTQTQLQQQRQQLQIPIKRRCVVENCENFLCGLDGARLGLVWPGLAQLDSPRRFVNNKWNANFQLHQKIISASNRRCCLLLLLLLQFLLLLLLLWFVGAALTSSTTAARSERFILPLRIASPLAAADQRRQRSRFCCRRFSSSRGMIRISGTPRSLLPCSLSPALLYLLPCSLCCLSLSRSVRFWPSSVWVYSPFAQLNFRNDCLSCTGLSTPDSGSVTGSSLIRQSGTRHQPSIHPSTHPSIGY